MKKYDVFISYRRSSYESANLIATRLKAAGYRVFFDLETMRSGPFNEQLFSVIEGCVDVVLVLPPDALDRCHNEDDWVRKEVLHAMKHKKNIIPILLNGFKWPEVMPKGLEQLAMYQSVAASIDFFDLAMERVESYLNSRKYTRARVAARWSAFVAMALIVLCCAAMLIFRTLAKPVCKQVVDHMSLKVCVADLLLADNKLLAEEWSKYDIENRNNENIALCKNIVRNNIAEYLPSVEPTITLSAWQRFLLSLYGVHDTDVASVDIYLQSMYSEVGRNLDLVGQLITRKTILPSDYDMATKLFKVYQLNGESLYYTYLQIVNQLPDSSREGYYEVVAMFENMPDTGLGLNRVEYTKQVERRKGESERIMDTLKQSIDEVKDEIFVQEQQIDSVYRAMVDKYRANVKRLAINPEEEMGYNWYRITVQASTLALSVEMRRDDLAAGDKPNPLTPQMVLVDMNRLLDDFSRYYSDVQYVDAARDFYRQMAEDNYMGGVLITQFAEGKTHDVYRVGDIIVEWNGERVKNLSQLQTAYAKSATGRVKLLRLENAKLKPLTIPAPGREDIVGFLDLVN